MNFVSPAKPATKLTNLFQFRRKLPVVMQAEAAECGLACLTMICHYHGLVMNLHQVRAQFQISPQGASLATLIDAAAILGLQSRAVKLELQHLSQLRTPCILHWNFDHFVVLKKVKGRNILLHDPATGFRRLSLSETGNHFTGVALELYPGLTFTPGDIKQKLQLRQLWQRLSGLKRNLLLIGGLSLLLQLLALLLPYYSQIVIDDVLLNHDKQLLLVLFFGFAGVVLVETACYGLRSLLNAHVALELGLHMSRNLHAHLLQLPWNYFVRRHLGDITSRFGSLEAVRDMLTNGVITMVLDGVLLLTTLAMMLLYSPKLTAVVVAVAIVLIILRATFFLPLRRLTAQVISQQAKADTLFYESMRSIQTIKLLQLEQRRQALWEDAFTRSTNRSVQLGRWQVVASSSNKLLFGLEHILVIFLAAHAAMLGQLSVGMLVAFLAYRTRFSDALEGLVNQVVQYRLLDVHKERLADMAFHPRETEGSRSVDGPPLRGALRLEGIGFSYDGGQSMLLQDVSFFIDAGEHVALTGPSGCGKTTLLHLMMGLLTPHQGKITADDKELRHLDGYRHWIAAVTQDDQLLSGTLEENICSFDRQVDHAAMVHCAELAHIHQDIMALPMQYRTLAGDLGNCLSGGQRQRLLLARALYRRPKILFLDEATSHLDPATERIIARNIRNLDLTRVTVAHRRETIASADRCVNVGQYTQAP